MYDRVYKCTHCSRKGYLIKFCFDRINHLNFAIKNVWVPIVTNPNRPKRYEYQNSHHFLFDVSVALTKCERVGILMVDAYEARWIYLINASLSRMFGGRTTMVWRLRE